MPRFASFPRANRWAKFGGACSLLNQYNPYAVLERNNSLINSQSLRIPLSDDLYVLQNMRLIPRLFREPPLHEAL